MANIAVIFAGGTGKRMNTKSKPKQFLELHNKPILVYTLEEFDHHPEIDGIVLVVLEEWIDYCRELVSRFGLTKVKAVIAGGSSAMESQRNGLKKAAEIFPEDSVVLIHDGVRPLIDEETISANIESVKTKGSAITVTPAIETITIKNETGEIGQIIERSKVEMARAPQSFYLKEILEAQEAAIAEGLTNMTDSCTLMKHFNKKLVTVPGERNNIKITTPEDFYTFRALYDAKENQQLE